MSITQEIEHALDECNLEKPVRDFLCERLSKSIASRLVNITLTHDEFVPVSTPMSDEELQKLQKEMFNKLSEYMRKGKYFGFKIKDGVPEIFIQISRF